MEIDRVGRMVNVKLQCEMMSKVMNGLRTQLRLQYEQASQGHSSKILQ